MLGNIEALNRGIQGIETNRKTRLVEKIKNIFSGKQVEDIEIEEDVIQEDNTSPYDFL
jgi:hypothetical protein